MLAKVGDSATRFRPLTYITKETPFFLLSYDELWLGRTNRRPSHLSLDSLICAVPILVHHTLHVTAWWGRTNRRPLHLSCDSLIVQDQSSSTTLVTWQSDWAEQIVVHHTSHVTAWLCMTIDQSSSSTLVTWQPDLCRTNRRHPQLSRDSLVCAGSTEVPAGVSWGTSWREAHGSYLMWKWCTWVVSNINNDAQAIVPNQKL